MTWLSRRQMILGLGLASLGVVATTNSSRTALATSNWEDTTVSYESDTGTIPSLDIDSADISFQFAWSNFPDQDTEVDVTLQAKTSETTYETVFADSFTVSGPSGERGVSGENFTSTSFPVSILDTTSLTQDHFQVPAGKTESTDVEFKLELAAEGAKTTSQTTCTVEVTNTSSTIPDTVSNNAYGWFDAGNINLSDGDSVSTRPDSSTVGNNITGTGTFQSAEVNGEDSVSYDGTNDLHATAVSNRVPKTWFVVFRWDGGTTEYNFQGILGDGGMSKNNRNMFGLTEDSNEWYIRIGENKYYGGSTDTNWHVGTFKNDGSTGFGRIDGIEFASGSNGGYATSENIVIGARDTDNPVYFSGAIPEAIFVNEDVSQSDIEQTEQTLADKYGITL